jgi:hypothetical protein
MINPLTKKQIIRIPWNRLILSYSKGQEPTLRSFDKASALYGDHRSKKIRSHSRSNKASYRLEEEELDENP